MALDPYNVTDTLDASIIDVMVERLEKRAQHPAFIQMLDQYLDAMRIETADHVIDLGCGTGVAARAIARRHRFRGRITGVDLSPDLIAAATRLAGQEGVADRVTFVAGDGGSVSLPDSGADAVVAHTLLSHVSDPSAVLAEAARLLKPGGLLGVFDGDYASMTFETEDSDASARMDGVFIGAVVTQPRVMRRMPRLARDLGLSVEACFADVLAEVGKGDYWASAVQAFMRLGPQSGAVTAEEAEAWVASLMRASEEDVFFAASNFYAYVLRKR